MRLVEGNFVKETCFRPGVGLRKIDGCDDKVAMKVYKPHVSV